MEEMVGVPFFHFHFYFVPLPSMRNNSRCPRRNKLQDLFWNKIF